MILFDGTGSDPIHRVSGRGRDADRRRQARRRAQGNVRSAGRSFCPTAGTSSTCRSARRADDSAYWIGSLDSDETKMFAPAQTIVTYAPPGYLLFVRDRTLVAQPFDAKALKTTGEPVPLAEQIGTDNVGLARFSVSRDGVLAYRTGESGGRLVWVDRAGQELDTLGDPGDYGEPGPFSVRRPARVQPRRPASRKRRHLGPRSRARRQLPFHVRRGQQLRAALVSRRRHDRVHVGPRRDSRLYEKSASGQGEEKLLLKSDELEVRHQLVSRRPVHRLHEPEPEDGLGHLGLPMFGDRKPIPFARGPSWSSTRVLARRPVPRVPVERVGPPGDLRADVSRPRRQVADLERRRGGPQLARRRQGALLPVPRPETHGGGDPSGGEFQAGIPQALFPRRVQQGNARNKYIPSADGQRFLFVAPLGRESMTPTTVVLNWYAGLGK